MAKRLFDIFFSAFVLVILSPLMLIAGAVIKLSSPGPILYKARRAGVDLKPITIYKFRSMHLGADSEGSITKKNDMRVFKFGSILRKSKFDEIPQFYNVIIGNMSIVGPRPEDIDIVKKYYNKDYLKTLAVKPGIASPGSIFNYTHYHKYLKSANDTDKEYVKKFLPIKLALERVYIEKKSFWYDLKVIFRTLIIIIAKILGKKDFDFPEEYYSAMDNGYF